MPTSATAGSIQELTIVYIAGEPDLQTGAAVRFELPVAYGETEPYFWSKPQTDYPDAPGYVTARATNGASVTIRTYGIAGGIFECEIGEAGIGPRDSLVVRYRGIVQSLARNVPIRYQLRASTQDTWTDGPNPPVIQIRPREAHTLITTAASDVQIGQPIEVAVVAIDKFGNRASGYQGTIRLESTDSTVSNLPTAYTFTEPDAGIHVFRDAAFQTTGFQRIRAVDSDTALQLSSHYTWVSESAPEFIRFFGDTHFHTGTGTHNHGFLSAPEDGNINTLALEKFQSINSGGDHRGNFTDARSAYTYARDVVRLDFASSAEHDAILFDSLTWRDSQDISESFDDPGRFTTFFAYEWTAGFIHHVVVYKDPGNEVLDRVRYPDLPALWQALDRQDKPALTIPHVSWTFEDHTIWDEVNDTYRRIGEIYSLWNSRFLVQPDDIPQRFELGPDDRWSYQHAWSHGHRIGLVGSTDNHLGRPGANNYTIYTHHTGGFAAAIARANTREDLWDAFQSRQTYATTGTRIYLDFGADGHLMGSEFTTSTPPTLRVRVAGTNRLGLVEIVKYQEGEGFTTIRSEEPEGDTAIFDHVDADFDRDALYYLRVTQEDEYPGRPWSHSTAEMGWSSPIWVQHSP